MNTLVVDKTTTSCRPATSTFRREIYLLVGCTLITYLLLSLATTKLITQMYFVRYHPTNKISTSTEKVGLFVVLINKKN